VAAAAEQALRGGPARNFQVFEPLDFIAEVTQHIPEAGQRAILMASPARPRVLAPGCRARPGAGGRWPHIRACGRNHRR